jgi:hypothetical protein
LSLFSPLHIPDEEALEMAAGLTPPASPIPSILGLSSDMGSPRYVVWVFVFKNRIYIVAHIFFILPSGKE